MASSATRSTAHAGASNRCCRRCRKAFAKRGVRAPTSTGTPGTTWRSTPTATRRCRTPSATVAFYAQFEQYEPLFAAHGFEKEARACHEAALRKEYATAGAAAVTDEMAETFVILGTPDECRAKVAELWDVADSFCLIPPVYSLPPDKAMFYFTTIADTFYE